MFFLHISYSSLQVQMSSGNVAQKKFYVHTDFKKLEGALAITGRAAVKNKFPVLPQSKALNRDEK